MSITCAIVNITTQDNATLADALQFGTVGDLSWSLAGQSFIMDIKASRDDTAALLELTSAAGQINTLDPVQRIIQFNVPDTVLAVLPPATYVYDFIMFDGSVPPIRIPLMQGYFTIKRGVTEN